MEWDIARADIEDAEEILNLQKLAYQSEAVIYQDFSIPPLTQTTEEIAEEFETFTFLKALDDGHRIVGSVRARLDGDSCLIGRLIVHPECQRQGLGTALMNAIEARFPQAKRYELFTGAKSVGNLRLYERLGYRPFKEHVVHESLSLVYLEKNGAATE